MQAMALAAIGQAIAASAPALVTPPPTYSTGRRAERSSAAASRTRLPLGRATGR